jgi:alpha-galactosidase
MKAIALLLLLLAVVYDTSALDNGLGRTPPMGWSSWNRLFNDVNATVIVAMAEAMAAGGYKDAGYECVREGRGDDIQMWRV